MAASAALTIAVAVLRPATAATFGDDGRLPLSQSRTRLAASIGLVSSGDGKHACTASCIGPSLIATAAHCILPQSLTQDGGPDAVSPVPMSFRLGGSEGTRVTGITTGSSLVLGTRSFRLKAPINAIEDWAIARLDTPLCEAHGLPFSTLSHAQVLDSALDGRVALVAFHRDVSMQRLSIEPGCAIEDTFPDRGADDAALDRDFTSRVGLLLHRCDTGLGSSGAPLIIETVAGPEIVGINIGTYHISRAILSEGTILKRVGSEPIANTAVGIRVLAPVLARLPESGLLKPGPEVVDLQQRLAWLGLYGGAWDGVQTLALRLAIITYERMHGMPETGLATTALAQSVGAAAPRTPAEPEIVSRRADPLPTGATR